jgi:hypothetical protein
LISKIERSITFDVCNYAKQMYTDKVVTN